MTYHGIPEPQWEHLVAQNRPLPSVVDACIHHEIERSSRKHPSKVAISASEGDVTYDQLNRSSNVLAASLAERGVGVEDIVPLCFEKSPLMIISMLAVLKAGAAFLAVDPSQPTTRIESILTEIGAKVVIASDVYKHLFGSAPSVMVLPGVSTLLDQTPRDDLAVSPPVSPRNAAYTIFTSGSTGKPKGIVIEHCSFLSGLVWNAPAQLLDENSRVLQFAAYSHDTCLVEILTTLCLGATICAPSEDERMNGLAEFINAKAITWAVLMPSFITTMEPSNVPTLKTVVLAGERVSQPTIETWAQSVTLLSGYGVSECSVATTVSRGAEKGTSASNIGRGAGASCWIVDPDDVNVLMPIGEVGEILVEGPTVGRGYINNPEATDASFIRPPMWLRKILSDHELENRLYRTGDLGRQNLDGSFDFVSRKDSQIKIAGRRIELSDIEHQISTLQGVRLCAVVHPRKGRYENSLVVFLELESAEPFETAFIDCFSKHASADFQRHTDNLAKEAKAKLPNYMIPKAWYAVDQFPRLPSAKIDRRFLQNWVDAQEHPAVEEDSDWEEIDPRDEIAIRVAREVTKLVKKDQSGSYRDVPFSELGVDSIRALSLKRILETAFKVKVKVEQLIDGNARPTGIAEIIRHAQSSNIDPLESTRQDLNARLHDLKTKMAFLASQAPHRYAERAEKKSTVFLTGSGGFLGLEILGQLRNMGHPVVALMRDSSMEIARNRLVESARARGLWFEQFEDELECWPGDLSKPYLGLSEELWARLSGTAPERCIEGIVHNGAVVHWTLSAEHLFPVNVDSTVWLLEACLKSPHIRHFSYISGGERGSGNIEEQLDEAHDGYTKTKLFSEALVQTCASITPELHNLRLSIIKPGFIIGKPEFGFANRRDFLWRFIKSVMELGVYDKDATEVWTYVSTDEFVAKVVIEQALQPRTAPVTSLIEEGTSEGEIWDTLNESYGLRLEPVDHTTWVTRVKSSIESGRESHPLWPLQEVLEQQQYGLGSKGESARRSGNERGRLKAAFLQNVRSLEDAPGAIE